MIRRLLAQRRGSVSLMVGLTAIPMILMGGLAMDATRLWLLHARLQQAVDAASLVAAYEIGYATQVADTKAIFWANFSSGTMASGKGFLGATSVGASVKQIDTAHVQVTATATLPVTLMAVGGFTSVSPIATAIAAKGTGYEIALALDISGSMLNSSGSGTTKEAALQIAANDMLDVVYGSSDTVANLSVSVVPFRGSVNMGPAHTGWLNAAAYAADNWALQAWRGCVQARTGGYDITEDNPGTSSFSPLYWASTYNTVQVPGKSTYYNGDNDWHSGNVTDLGVGVSTTSSYSGLPVGPNLGCSTSPVLPLTASKTTVKATVNGMIAASGGSTVVSQSLQWAWFTLSPLWQAYWGLSANPTGLPRPLAYNTPANQKIVILMTDGNNEWDGNEQTSQNLNCRTTVVPECVQADGYSNSYGRLSANRLGIAMPATSSTPSGNSAASNNASALVVAALDARTLTLCSTMKAAGITIFTIAFQAAAGSDAENLLLGCATDASHYYNTNTGSDIDAAFTSIGQQIIALKITQ